MLLPHDQREPETHDVDGGLDDPASVEELGLAERPVVMMDRNLDDPEPGIVNLLHHLEADDAARLLELDALEDGPSHQSEVAVHVADVEAEHRADNVMI